MKRVNPQTLAIGIVIALGLAYAIYYIATAAKWIPYPYQIDYGEGYNLFYAKLWGTGAWSWNISTEPHLILMYGPLYFALAGQLYNAFGLTFEWGRIAMAISTAVSCIFVGLIAYQFSRNKLLSIAAGLLPLTQPIIRDWGIQSRVDPFAAMLDIIGIWWAVKFRNSKWFYAALIFLAAAFYSKVSIIGIVAVIVFLLINREWKRMAIFTGAAATLVIVPMIIVPGLYYHMIKYNLMPTWDNPVAILMPIIVFVLPLIGIIILALYYAKTNKKSLATIWLASAAIISTIQLLKKGSSTNYYIEAIYVICLVGVLAIPTFIEYIKRHYEWKWLGVCVIGLLFVLPIVTNPNPQAFPLPNQAYTQAVTEVKEIISDTNEPIPTENAGVVVLAGKDLEIEPMMFTQLANDGVWDQSQYVSDLQNQRFDYIVLRGTIEEHLVNTNGHFTAAASQAIYENYSLIYEHLNSQAWWYIIRVYEANRKLGI